MSPLPLAAWLVIPFALVGPATGRLARGPVVPPPGSSPVANVAGLRGRRPVASAQTVPRRGEVSSLLQRGAADVAASLLEAAPIYRVTINADWAAYGQNGAHSVTMSVDADTQGLRVAGGLDKVNGIAWGSFRDAIASNGWTELNLETTRSEGTPNGLKMYASGFLEGLVSASRTQEFHTNLLNLTGSDKAAERAMKRLRERYHKDIAYIKEKTSLDDGGALDEPSDPYWKHVFLLVMQLWGIRDGHNHATEATGATPLDMVDMFVINGHAELQELLDAHAETSPFALVDRGAERLWERRLIRHGHCSAFVRLASDKKDLMVGHTTWSDYSKMTRVFKYYNFSLSGVDTVVTSMGFSSYPGCVSSTDSFYMLDSGLVVMDTSLEVVRRNRKVSNLVEQAHVPSFIHVMAVNRLSNNAAHWVGLFAGWPGGGARTSAQWMVVDYNRFVPGQTVAANTLWVLEYIPGLMHKADVSQTLREQGYWASYNRPYFDDVRRASGHAEEERLYGALYSFTASPRATIFKNIGPHVEDLFDMRSLMNRNHFQVEDVSPNGPGHAISSRMDLDEGLGAIPNGGIDAKVAGRCLIRALQCQAVSGPTHDDEPPFRWTSEAGKDLFPSWSHVGLPNAWTFGWVHMAPTLELGPAVDDIGTC